MFRWSCLAVVAWGVLLAGIPSARAADEEGDVSKAIRQLAPAAAAMNKADWEKLARSPAGPKADDVDDQPLALLILTLPLIEKPTEAEAAEVRTASPVPNPNQMAGAFQPTRFHPITPLHAGYIRRVTANVEGDAATGEIAFEAKGVYTGKVGYTARQADGQWKIVEFRFPTRHRRTALNAEGKWKLGTIEGD